MNPQLLYLEDPAVLEFDTTIIEMLPLPGDQFGAVLERSYFYPTGGGQEHDTGQIGEAHVLDVYKEGDRVIHVVDRVVPAGPAHATIEPERRLRNTQNHTAQHLLSACFLRLFSLETVSAHISGYGPSNIDLPVHSVSKQAMDQAEALANRMIWEDRAVRTSFVEPAELARLSLRGQPKVSEDIRIVAITDFDVTPCGGTHCASTGNIGLLKILRSERPNKDLTRVVFVAGWHALDVFRQEHDITGILAAQLGVAPVEIPAVVQRQSEQLRANQETIRIFQEERITQEAAQLAASAEVSENRRLVLASFEGRPVQELRQLAGELKGVEGLLAVLATYDGQKLSVAVSCGPGCGLSAREVISRLLAWFGGRGGGDASIAQGGGAATPEQAQNFTGAARAILSEMLG